MIARVDDCGVLHDVAHAREVEPAELVPLGEERDDVGTGRGLVGIRREVELRHEPPRLLGRGGIERTNRRAVGEQPPDDCDRR